MIATRGEARQLLVEVHTEDFRERLAKMHEQKAAECQAKVDTLNEWAAAYGGGGELGRAISRTCPTCGAKPNAPCSAWKRVGRTLDHECPKCGAEPGDPCTRKDGREAKAPHGARSRLRELELQPLAALHEERNGMRELDRLRVHHENRAKGVRGRFDIVRGCGKQILAARCSCGEKGKATPKGCGKARLCAVCSERDSVRRRRAFGHARGVAILDAVAGTSERPPIAGARAKYRKGGRYTDKMLTLTIPHVDGPMLFQQALELDGQGDNVDDRRAANARKILALGSDTVTLRVALLFAAWPVFLRRLREHLKARGNNDHAWTKFDRFFEWTEGGDKKGHPHFHVWLFSPFLCSLAVGEMWTASLRDVGVPVQTKEIGCGRPGCSATHTVGARIWLQRMGDFDERAVRELIAGRKSIELATFRTFDVGPNVSTYAAGWSVQDIADMVDAETEAKLSCAIEGRRLSQSSRGFYSMNPPSSCPCCGAMGSRAVVLWSEADEQRTAHWNETRGPPLAKTEPHNDHAQERHVSP
jgi:hypothetical protein